MDKMEAKPNRRLIALFFGMTGIVSLGLWLVAGGKVKWQDGVGFGQPKILSFDVVGKKEKVGKDTAAQTKKLEEQILARIAGLSGSYEVFVYRLEKGEGYGVNEDKRMTATSFMKVPIMVTVYKAVEKGKMTLQDKYTLVQEDKRDGTGSIDILPVGSELTVGQLVEVMGKESDNTAAAALTHLVGSNDVEKSVKEMGMDDSSFADNMTTAKDVAMMWANIYQAKVIGSSIRGEIEKQLQDSIYEDRITAGVPTGVKVLHKVGTGDGIWSDGGVIIPNIGGKPPFVLVIMNEGVNPDEAKKAVPEMAKLVWSYEEARTD